MILSRRSALALLGASALAACGKSGGAPVLKVGSQRGGTKAMLEASGVLAGLPYRIEWSEFPAAQHLLEALAAGAVDLGGVGDAPFLFAYQGGSPIKSVQAVRYEPRNAANAILVPAHSPIQDAAGLRGRKIATGRGSVGHFLLLRALKRAGLTPDDVSILFLSPGDAKGAFASGAIDAWSIWSPYAASALLHDGARVIVDARGLTTGYGFTAANVQSIEAKRPLIADFLERQTRAQDWTDSNVDAYATVIARETGLPADVSRSFVDRRLTTIRTDAALIAELETVQNTFVEVGAITVRRNIKDAFDTSFESTA